MKNGLKRLISLLLCLVLTVSAVPVFVFAEQTQDEETTGSSPNPDTEGTEEETTPMPENFRLLYDRTFSEGWPLSNGLSISMKNQSATLDYDRSFDGKYNYFGRVTALGTGDGYMAYSFPASEADQVVFEMDIKADDYCNIGNHVLYIRTKGAAENGTVFYLLTIRNNVLYLVTYSYEAEQPGDAIPDPKTGEPNVPLTLPSSSIKIADLTNEWIKLSFVFDYSNGGIRGKEFTLTTYWILPDGTTGSHSQLLRSKIDWAVGEDGEYILENGKCVDLNVYSPRVDFFRLGIAGSPASTDYGTSFCFDNLRMYEGVSEPFFKVEESWGLKNGISVNSDAKPTVEIKGNDDIKIVSTDNLAMKVGVDYCLNAGVREPIYLTDGEEPVAYGAPFKLNGVVYVPIMKLLEATGLPYYMHNGGQALDITTGQSVSYITIGKTVATVDGQKITLTAAPGYYEDDNGNKFLAVAMDDIETLLNGWYITYDELGLIIFAQEDNVMNRYDHLAEMRDLMGEFVFEYKTGEEVLEDARETTDNFNHPYLIADQDKFDWVRDVYLAEDENDPNYNKAIQTKLKAYVASAEEYYQMWSVSSGTEMVENENGTLTEVKKYDEYLGLMTDREIDEYNKNFLKTVSWGTTDIHNGTALYQPYIYAGADAVRDAVDKGNNPNKEYVIGDGGWITGYDNDALYTGDRYYYSGYTYAIYGHYFTNDVLHYVNDDGEIEVYKPSSGTTRDYTRCVAKNYNGYDPEGGRTGTATLFEYVQTLALAYQITRDDKYLLCAYDVVLRLGQWYHWGMGHFLDTAGSTMFCSYFYDWCYDRIKELGEEGVTSRVDGKPLSTETIAKIIYTHGVYSGYRAVTAQGVGPNAYRDQGNITNFYKQYNNWNGVCSNGMIMGALAIMNPEEHDFTVNNPDDDQTELRNDVEGQIFKVFEDCFYGLTSVGCDQYAPDGSYSEGIGYWSYGTGRIFTTATVLVNTCGTDYGLLDAPGMDMTCTYAYSLCSSDFVSFPYSDGSMSTFSLSHLIFIGQQLKQQMLIDVRMAQFERYPSFMNFYDILFYPEDAVARRPEELDYYSTGVDMFTTRESWENGALYAGVHGGKNKTADHNQIDAGHFIYYNKDVTWLIDIGTESYNVYGYGNADVKYRYYRSKPEGHNTICITTDQKNVPFGQVYDSEARAYEVMTENNPHGSYAKFDMTETLGPTCNYWKRGILLTNDRQTTIIQDEISLNTTANLYWFAHFNTTGGVDAWEIEPDGKTVYLINYGAETGKTAAYNYDKNDDIWLRVTLVASSSKLKFEVWDAYTYVHSNIQDPSVEGFTHKNNYNPDNYTFVSGDSESMGGRQETGRGNIRKLVVRAEQDISLEMAVVIEIVDQDPATRYAVGYSWQYMDGSATYGPWEPTEDRRYKAEYVPDQDGLDRSKYKLSIFKDISKYLQMCTRAENINTYMTNNYEEFFKYLASAKYLTVKYKDQIASVDTYKQPNEIFLETIEIFDMYRNEVVSVANSRDAVCESLLGVKITE